MKKQKLGENKMKKRSNIRKKVLGTMLVMIMLMSVFAVLVITSVSASISSGSTTTEYGIRCTPDSGGTITSWYATEEKRDDHFDRIQENHPELNPVKIERDAESI